MRLESVPQLMVVAVAFVGGSHVLATDAPRWADDILREKGIVTREELIRALEDRETRALAAGKNAQTKRCDTQLIIQKGVVPGLDPGS